MRQHETRCQCKKLGTRCIADMTAEDLLCDSCREGCNTVWIAHKKGEVPTVNPDDQTGYHFAVTRVIYGPMHWPDGGTAV
jgi:hypothetical protein